MPRNSASSASSAPKPADQSVWERVGIPKPPEPLVPPPHVASHNDYGANAYGHWGDDGWYGASMEQAMHAAAVMQHQWHAAHQAQRKAQNAAKAAKQALASFQKLQQDMATAGNTQAANFLMRQKMTGKALIGGLHSAIPVTQAPDDGEEFYETTTVQPEPVAREHGVHVADMDDYQHTLQLEGDGFEVDDDGNLYEEPDHEHDHGDMQQLDDKTIFPDDQPDEVEWDHEAQTLHQDDETVLQEENEDTQTEIPLDDQTVFQDDELQGHHFDDGDDEKRVQLPGIDVPSGARKKRRTA